MSVNLGSLKAYLGLDLSGLTSGLAGANSALGKAGASMKAAGATLTRSLSLPLAALGGVSIKMAVDFQTSMRKIQTLVGLTVDRVNGMSKAVVGLSNLTGESSKGLADALFVVTSAGQRGKEAMEILDAAAKSAALGLGETKDVARAVTAVMNAYGKENISAAKATDQLVSIVREGNLEAAELAPVLGRVIGLASTLGISFAEVGASIATFTRLGVDSAEAVTGLRGIMNTLIKPTESGAEALAKVGLTFKDLREQIRQKGLAVALIDLMNLFKGDEESLAALVPNVRALGALLGTAGTQAATYAEIARNVAAANGLVDDGFKSIANDSGFQFKRTLEQLKNVGIELGLQLLPIFNKVLGGVSKLVKKFSELDTATKQQILAFSGLAIAIGPILTIMGTLAAAFAFLVSPIGLVIVAVAGLAAAMMYLDDNWRTVEQRFNEAASAWKNSLINMVQSALAFNPFSQMIDSFNSMLSFFGANPIPDPFEGWIESLEAQKDPIEAVGSWYGSFGETVTKATDKAKAALSSLFAMSSGSSIGGGGTVLSGGVDNGTPVAEASSGPKLNLPVINWAALNGEASGQGVGSGAGLSPAGSFIKEIDDMTTKVGVLGSAMQTQLNTAFVEFGETLGSVFSGDGGASGFFDGLLQIVAGFMKAFGSALIAAGVASQAFQDLLINPFAAIAAGVALVALSSVVATILKKGPGGGDPQGLASGGFVTSGGVFKVGEKGPELVTLPTGSAVTPNNIAMGKKGGRLYAEVSGTMLRFILDEEDRRTGNTR